MKKKRSFRLALFVCFVDVVIITIYFFVIGMLTDMGRARAAAVSRQDVLLSNESFLSGLTQTLAHFDHQVHVVDTVFISEDSASRFIEYLESLGAKASVTVKVQGATPVSGHEHTFLSSGILVSGTLADIASYLSLLEHSPFLIDVQSVQYARSGEVKVLWQAQITILLKSFEGSSPVLQP